MIEGTVQRMEWLRKYGTLNITGEYGVIAEWKWQVHLDYGTQDTVFFYEYMRDLDAALAEMIGDVLAFQNREGELT